MLIRRPLGSQEDLTPESTIAILDALAAGKSPKTGPQNGRSSSEPLGKLTALIEEVRKARCDWRADELTRSVERAATNDGPVLPPRVALIELSWRAVRALYQEDAEVQRGEVASAALGVGTSQMGGTCRPRLGIRKGRDRADRKGKQSLCCWTGSDWTSWRQRAKCIEAKRRSLFGQSTLAQG